MGKQSSSAREVHVKLLRFEVRARRLTHSASSGACHRPTLGLGPMIVFLHSCLMCCLCWRGDQLLHASRRGGHEASVLSSQSQSVLSPERGELNCRTLGVLRLRFAVLELGGSRGFSELGDSCEFSELGDSESGTVNTDHRSATMWVRCAHFSYTFWYSKRLRCASL